MIYWDYKKNEWVDFYHLKSGCFHTLRSHNCIQTPYKSDFCIIVVMRRS